MGNRILAVHLSPRRVCLAAAESSIGSLRVTAIFEFEHAKATSIARMMPDQRWDRVIASLPADEAAFRLLEFPFRDRRRLDQAVAPALEEHVPFSLEEVVCAYDHTSRDRRGSVLAAMVPSSALDRQLTALAAFDIHAEHVVWAPSAVVEIYRRACGSRDAYTVVDVSADGAILATLDRGALTSLRIISHCSDEMLVRNLAWSVRSNQPLPSRLVVGGPRARALAGPLAAALPECTLEALPSACPLTIQGAPGSDWRAAAPALGLIYAATGDAGPPSIDFWRADSAAKEEGKDFAAGLRALVPWAVTAAVLAFVASGVDYARLRAEQQALQTRADALVQRAIPGTTGGPGQRVKMEMRLGELLRQARQAGGGDHGSPLLLLATLSASLPTDLQVEFDGFFYDPPNVRMSGRAGSFEAVTKLQETLKGQAQFRSVEAKDVHAAVSGEGVDFQLSIALAQPGGSA